jgi:hypothetical protein
MTLTTCQNLTSDFRFSTTLIIVGFGKKIQNQNARIFSSKDGAVARDRCCSRLYMEKIREKDQW